MDDPETWTTLGTRHRMKTNKTKHSTQKTKKITNTDPIKNWVWTMELMKKNHFYSQRN